MFEVAAPRIGTDLDPIRAAYFLRVRNVGDAVAPLLLEAVTGRPTTMARTTDRPYLLSIGSLVQTSTPQAYVWGTGLIHPSVGVGAVVGERVLALRGKLTHEQLRRHGVSVGDVPLGDPGMLVPNLFPAPPGKQLRYRLGLVPYVFDRDHPFFRAAAAHDDVVVLDVCADPADFFADLVRCDVVASSSLHGLIFAEAYGIPTLWLRVSDNVTGGGFKFADWFSLAHNPQREPYEPVAFLSAHDIVQRCEPRHVEIDTSALRAALRPDVIEACRQPSPGRTTVAVAECRSRKVPVFLLAGTAPSSTVAGHPCVVVDGSDRVNEAIGEYFRDWDEPSRFAVAADAADLALVEGGALRFYADLLDRFPRVDSVGSAGVADPPHCGCGEIVAGPDAGVALYRAGRMLSDAMRSLRVCAGHGAPHARCQ